MTDQHAPFAPSGLARVVACPGSFNLLRAAGLTLDEDDTDASREGTAAHWVASEALYGRWYEVGALAPNGVAVTDEMAEGAEMWRDALFPTDRVFSGKAEQHIECPAIHHDCHGTPDFTYGPDNGQLLVADYKFGHRYVDPFENWQLIAYASGTMPEYYPTMRITLRIVQPRSYHRDGPVRDWVIDGDQLRDYVTRLRIACVAALEPGAKCVTGPQCYMCPARHVCEAALHMEQSALYLAGTSVPLDISVEAKAVRLRQVRRALDHLKQMESGLTDDLSARIRGGGTVPGFTLRAGAGREKWTKEVGEVVALGAVLGVDLSKPGVVTPNQARKAGVPDDMVAAYSERQSGSVSLVEVDVGKLAGVFARPAIIHKEV